MLPLNKGIACILLVYDDVSHMRVVFIFVDNRQTVVCGFVVQDDDLKVLKALGKNTVNSFTQIFAMIVVGYDDAYEWLFHFNISFVG